MKLQCHECPKIIDTAKPRYFIKTNAATMLPGERLKYWCSPQCEANGKAKEELARPQLVRVNGHAPLESDAAKVQRAERVF